MKILIADADNFFRILLSQLLYDDGYDVTSAHTAGRAWEYLIKDPPDICIFDSGLPEICEMAMEERGRPGSWFSSIPVILLTGGGQVPEAWRNAADFYVEKKRDADGLLPRIEELLGEISNGAGRGRS